VDIPYLVVSRLDASDDDVSSSTAHAVDSEDRHAANAARENT